MKASYALPLFVLLIVIVHSSVLGQANAAIKPTGDYYALIIGESQYDNPKLVLDRPGKDAKKFYDLIIAKYTFNQNNVKLLQDPSRQQIITELFNLRKKITSNDNLLIFYAGHGYWDDEASQGYWWPRDAAIDEPSNWLSNSDLKEQIRGIKSAHTLLISDACFSGGIFKTRSAAEAIKAASFNIQMLYKMPSRRAMTSGTLTAVPDESVFFNYLVKRLNENSNIYLPSQELFSSLKQAVINNSLVVPQDGVIADAGDEGGDFIFILKNSISASPVASTNGNLNAEGSKITRGVNVETTDDLFEKGTENLNSKKFDEAYADFSNLILQDPQNAKAYNARGRASYGSKRFNKAIDDFSKAIELKPDFSWPWLMRGLTKMELGKLPAAIIDYNKAIEISPRYATAFNDRGIAEMRLKRNDEALKDFSEAIQLDAKYVLALDNRGILKIRMGKPEEALIDLNKAIEINPRFAGPYADKGMAEVSLGKLIEAEADILKALEMEPTMARAYNYRGLLEVKKNNPDVSLTYFSKAIEINSHYTDAYINRAKAHVSNKDFASALADVNKVLELFPANTEAVELKTEIQKAK